MKSPNDLQEELIFYQEAAKSSLLNFAQLVDPKYDVSWHHDVLASALEKAYYSVKEDKPARIIITMPPRHGKSRLATEIFPAWILGKDPTIPVITASYNFKLSEKFGGSTKDILASEIYQSLFPGTLLRKDSRAKSNWGTVAGGKYIGAGVGGPITGFGAKLAIIDDPIKNREEANSQTYRDKVWDWYTSTLYTRLEGAGALIAIATRWHMDDFIGRLISKQKEDEKAGKVHYDKWEVINFPAIAEDDEPPYRKAGEPLWPEKFSLNTLYTIRNIDVEDWSSLYQQKPISSANQEFKKEFFKTYTKKDIKDLYLSYYTFVDPAISQKDSADNSVVLTVAKEVKGPRWFRIREDAGRLTPGDLLKLIFKHQEEYDSKVYLETVAYQESLKYSIQEEQRKREKYWTINEFKPRGNKEARIRGLLPLYQAGVIYHLPNDFEYERELLEFPKSRHDDRADAMSFGLTAIENTRTRDKIKVFAPKIVGYFE